MVCLLPAVFDACLRAAESTGTHSADAFAGAFAAACIVGNVDADVHALASPAQCLAHRNQLLPVGDCWLTGLLLAGQGYLRCQAG